MKNKNKNIPYAYFNNKPLDDNNNNSLDKIRSNSKKYYNNNTNDLDAQLNGRINPNNPYNVYQNDTNNIVDSIPKQQNNNLQQIEPENDEFNPHPGYVPRPTITFKRAFVSAIIIGFFWIIFGLAELSSFSITLFFAQTSEGKVPEFLIVLSVILIILTIILTVVFWFSLTGKWGDYLSFPMVLLLSLFFLGFLSGIIVIARVCSYKRKHPKLFKNGTMMVAYVKDPNLQKDNKIKH